MAASIDAYCEQLGEIKLGIIIAMEFSTLTSMSRNSSFMIHLIYTILTL